LRGRRQRLDRRQRRWRSSACARRRHGRHRPPGSRLRGGCRMTATMDVARAEIPMARVVPTRPLTLADHLVTAIEDLEAFLLDAYDYGRVQDPDVVMLQGMRDAFLLVLGQLPLLR